MNVKCSELEQLVSGLSDPAVVLAADGETIQFANDAFAGQVGSADGTALRGSGWRTLIDSGVAPVWESSIRRATDELRRIAIVDHHDETAVEHQVIPILEAGRARQFIHVAHASLAPAAPEPDPVRGVDIAQRVANIGYFTLRLRSGTMTWSGELLRIAGRDPADAPTVAAFLEAVHPNDRDRVRDTLDPALLRLCVAGTPGGRAPLQGVEFRFVRPDGDERWLRAAYDVTFDARGEPVSLLGVAYDVTKQRELDEARLTTMRRYREFVESSPYGVFEVDRDGVVHPMNAACRRMLATRQEQGSFLDLVADRDRLWVRARVAAALVGEASELEFETIRGVRIRSALTPLHDARGAPYRVRGTTVDVTEATRMQVALRQSEQRYRQLVEQAGDGIFLADGAGRYIDVNARGCEILGCTREEALRLGIGDVVRPEEVSGTMQRLADLPAGGTVRTERELCRPRGGVVPVEITASRLFDGHLLAIVRDVTERRCAEARLRKSEQGLVEAQRIAKVGSWELDLVHDRLTWSDELHRMFEIDRTRFAASYEAFLDAVHPDDRELVHGAYQRSLATRSPYEIVHRLRMADGRIKWVQERCETFYDDAGRAIRSIGTAQDVSERVRAEDALRDNEARFRTVVESFPSGVLLVDADGRIMLANRELLAQFGYEAYELVGREIECLVPAAVRARHASHREEYRAAPSARAMGMGRDLRGVRKDGSLFPVEIGLQPIQMPDGPMTLATVIDVTERARAEEELRRHSQVLLEMGEGAHFLDEGGIIRFTNPALDAMFGYERGELLGQHVSVLNDVPAEENARMVRQLVDHVHAKGSWTGEFRNRRKDGSIFHSSARISTIDRPGGVLFVTIQKDITERKTSEKRIRDSLREKETLLREVHHRVKNNLQMVCSLLSLQRSTVGDPSARAGLADCEARVRIMAMIHEQLYQSSDLGAIDLCAHVRALAANMAQAQRSIPLNVRCDGALLLGLDAAVPIGLILHELIGNAQKHALPSGATAVDVELRRRSGTLALTVRDDGAGVPNDWRARSRGALGLNLVAALADQLDGHFELRNEGGAVAEVTMSVPLHEGGGS
jgi:PAS domain S-box-containing protein